MKGGPFPRLPAEPVVGTKMETLVEHLVPNSDDPADDTSTFVPNRFVRIDTPANLQARRRPQPTTRWQHHRRRRSHRTFSRSGGTTPQTPGTMAHPHDHRAHRRCDLDQLRHANARRVEDRRRHHTVPADTQGVLISLHTRLASDMGRTAGRVQHADRTGRTSGRAAPRASSPPKPRPRSAATI